MEELAERIAPCAMLTGALMLQSPKNESVAQTVEELRELDVASEWPFGNEHDREDAALLLRESEGASLEQLDREYHHLFVGPKQLEAQPWGSVYLDSESVVFGDSCVELVRWMRKNGVEMHEGASREPADHIGRMLVLLSWLCEHELSLVEEYLRLHLLTWTPRYFERFDAAAAESPFYRGVARLASMMLLDLARAYGPERNARCA